jgi:hypothetical protein
MNKGRPGRGGLVDSSPVRAELWQNRTALADNPRPGAALSAAAAQYPLKFD